MSEINEGVPTDITAYSYALEGRDGSQHPAKFFKMDRPLGEMPESELAKMVPQVVDVAKRCFTHWTDDGERFRKILTERANRVSLVFDDTGENVVAFNVYEQGPLELDGVEEPVDMVYTHYAGVDPKPTETGATHRGQGLMESSRTHDSQTMNPDVISGCTAAGAILKGVRATAKELGRQMYPDIDKPLPPSVGKLGRAIYTKLNDEAVGASVDTNTLVRHGKSEYLRGVAPDPLQALLTTNNDAILYTSLSPSFAQKIGVAPAAAPVVT